MLTVMSDDLRPVVQPAAAGTGGGPGTGAEYAWSGNRKAGKGAMTIVSATEPSQVAIDLRFEKPFRARNDTVFSIRPEGSGCRVTWSMTGTKTLMTRVMGLVKSMDSFLGPDFESGLARLKAAAESPGQQ